MTFLILRTFHTLNAFISSLCRQFGTAAGGRKPTERNLEGLLLEDG